jgi:hypothetical protein
MGIQNNSFTQNFPNFGFVVGAITGAASTPAFAGLGGSVASGMISVTDNGTGDWTLVITDFKGPKGKAYGFANAGTLPNTVSVGGYSYSGNTLSIEFKCVDAAGSAADDTINVQIWAA